MIASRTVNVATGSREVEGCHVDVQENIFHVRERKSDSLERFVSCYPKLTVHAT